jgi:uncharacterized protein (DUF488 family)
MQLYTIGFTKKTAEQFFNLLKEAGVERLVDIRLHPDSQLSGFAKREDLRYFLSQLIGCEYVNEPSLAPSDEILKAYRKNKDWEAYETGYMQLLKERNIPVELDKATFEKEKSCLLCSEAEASHCHRRLAAEEIQRYWKDVEIIHL